MFCVEVETKLTWFNISDSGSWLMMNRKEAMNKAVQVFFWPPMESLHVVFYKKPALVPVSANWKKSKRIFAFAKKGRKQKQHSACFAASCVYRGSAHSEQGGDTAKHLSWVLQSASQHQATIALNSAVATVLYLGLFFTSIRRMCPKVPGWKV